MIPPLMVWLAGMFMCLVDEIQKKSNTNHLSNYKLKFNANIVFGLLLTRSTRVCSQPNCQLMLCVAAVRAQISKNSFPDVWVYKI